MKKITTICIFTLMTLSFWSQVQNGGFENWISNPTFDHPDVSPATFTSSNNEVFLNTGLTPCTEVPGTEGSAARVETMDFEGELVPGYGIFGNTPEGDDLIFSGGFPFTDMNVTGITFDARYNISILSPGFVIVQFLADGMPVTGGTDDSGTYIIPIFGVQESWTDVSYTFSDPLTQTPDMCIIGFASNDVVNETGFAGNYLEIDNLEFTGTSETIPGGDMNTWIEVDNGESPQDWLTILPLDLDFIQKDDSDPLEGMFNVRLETQEFFEDTVQSMIFQGSLTEEGFFPSEPMPSNAFAFDFNYKYSNTETDSATVYFLFSEVLDPEPGEVAIFIERLDVAEDWTNYTIDFSDVPLTPNYYGAMFFSGLGFDEYNAPGSILELDAVGFLTGDDCEFTPTIVNGDVQFCPNDGTELETQLYDEYSWWVSIADEDEFEIVGTDSILPLAEADPGIYDVYLSATLDECVATSDTILVEIIEIPDANAYVDGEISGDVCAGENITIEMNNPDDFETFQWNLLGFDIPGATESEYEVLGVLDLTSVFVCEVTIAECPDLVIQSSGVTVNSHSAPLLIITQDGNTLSVADLYEDYQWYLDGEEIDGATESSYDITEDGSYSVTATNEWDCLGTSFDFDAVYTGIGESELIEFNIYPNPAEDLLTIEGLRGKNTGIEIYNLSGQIVMSKNFVSQAKIQLDLSVLVSGTYLIKLINDQTVRTENIVVK